MGFLDTLYIRVGSWELAQISLCVSELLLRWVGFCDTIQGASWKKASLDLLCLEET